MAVPENTGRPQAPALETAQDDGDLRAPMTPAQLSELKSLSAEAGDPDAFGATLTKAEAALRIATLKTKMARERAAGIDRRPRT
jgi:hypothetical protein